LNQIPSGFFIAQSLGSPLGGFFIMRSGHCWRATCRCANNARSRSSRGSNCQVNPSSLSEEEAAPFLFLCPGLRSRKHSPRRELQPKRTILSSLEVPFLHAKRCTLCLAPPLVAPLA